MLPWNQEITSWLRLLFWATLVVPILNFKQKGREGLLAYSNGLCLFWGLDFPQLSFTSCQMVQMGHPLIRGFDWRSFVTF